MLKALSDKILWLSCAAIVCIAITLQIYTYTWSTDILTKQKYLTAETVFIAIGVVLLIGNKIQAEKGNTASSILKNHNNYILIANSAGKIVDINMTVAHKIFGANTIYPTNITEVLQTVDTSHSQIIIDAILNGKEISTIINQKAIHLKPCRHFGTRYTMITFTNISILTNENNEMGIYVTDPSNKIIACNNRMSNILNMQEWQILDKDITQLIDHYGEIVNISPRYSFNVIRNNNQEPYINQTIHPDQNSPNPNSCSIINPHMHSMTMHYMKQFYFDNMNLSAFIINDEKGDIQYSNKRFKDEVCSDTDKNIFDILDNHDTIKRHLAKIIGQKDETLPQEFIQTTVNGMHFTLYLNRITTDPHNTTIVGYLMDVTEQKKLEANFVHSQKMQVIGQLAGGIAHDFNNLLTAIIGFSDLLLMRHPKGDTSFADIMQIKQNANRAANLVRQLLALSRKQVLQPKVINVTESITDLIHLIRRLIGENIKLQISHDIDIAPVMVDQNQLEQVIINVVVNARDAMREEGGVLEIKTSTLTLSKEGSLPKRSIDKEMYHNESIAPGTYVMIEISDNGTGIKPEIVEQIFEPFFSTKEIGSGVGLGLSTAHGIIKQTGGHIIVESAPSKGTNFIILLPHSENYEMTTPTPNKTQNNTDLTGNATILLIEDESAVRTLISNVLNNKGYTVLEAESGQKALEIFEENKNIDLVITDVIMPGIKGTELAQRIQATSPEIKVIFISGYTQNELMDRQNGKIQGYKFLAKPFTFKELVTIVKQTLEEASTAQSAS